MFAVLHTPPGAFGSGNVKSFVFVQQAAAELPALKKVGDVVSFAIAAMSGFCKLSDRIDDDPLACPACSMACLAHPRCGRGPLVHNAVCLSNRLSIHSSL